jgi:alanine dehydrogenase
VTIVRIGVPEEIKNHEHRVSITPAGVRTLLADGHDVLVQSGAGEASGFPDTDYIEAGAHIVATAEAAWAADMVVKVKEPLAAEYAFLRPELILFTFLHLAAAPQLARVLMGRRVCALAYETVQLPDGTLPVLASMSQVAGRVAAQLAVRFLQKENGTPFAGKGRLVGGLADMPPAQIVVLGAGNVGLHAADALAGLGGEVTLLEAIEQRVDSLRPSLRENISVLHFCTETLHRLLPDCDILIGAALIAGKHAPGLLRRSDLRRMQPGSVFVDVSIDQGGISESSRPTTYDEPVYVEEGVIHCCLPNLPGAVPLTSTIALTHASLPYIRLIANHGVSAAAHVNQALSRGINIQDGRVVHDGVAESLGFRPSL